MASGRPFRAFVSYSHADAAFAAWLQRKLEGYRLPKRLAGQVEPLPGQAQGRIGPVFRDRADLSAAADLSTAVKEGIAASSALVVVASPEAAKSSWVALEITLFRELYPDAPVLVALVRGESEQAVPEALRAGGLHPLAADFRKQGDGKRLAFLKIVAGLAGLSLDTLVQRDAQRQVRRVTGVTLGAVVLVVIMALLLVIALRAREDAVLQRVEAERRRLDAEGLVQYMLTDLREKLKGVGRLDVMSGVNGRAMAYYSAQGDLRRLPDTSLAQRARILHLMGADNENAGDLDQALAQYREAHRTTAAILTKKPREPDRIFAHAQSEFYIGSIALRRKEFTLARRHWIAYLQQAQALSKAEPHTIRALLEQGYAWGNLCDLSRQDNQDLRLAESQCSASIRFEIAALNKDSGNREVLTALANRHGFMAQIHFANRQYDRSLESCRAGAALLDHLLAEDPRNFEFALRRSWADLCMANAWSAVGRLEETIKILRSSRERHKQIFLGDTDSERVMEARLRAHLLLAWAQRGLGQSFAAEFSAAAKQERAIAALGSEFAGRAKAIRVGLWRPEKGN